MEGASRALVETHYLECERLCVEALRLAREAEDFDRYARILLPLQEARRQRRQIAVDAGVFVLAGGRRPAGAILDRHAEGCLLLIDPPYTIEDERAVRALARERERMVEVLLVGQAGLRQVFEQQMERVGDAAVSAVDSTSRSPVERLDALAAVLDRVGDHEIAHQRLAEAARAIQNEPRL